MIWLEHLLYPRKCMNCHCLSETYLCATCQADFKPVRLDKIYHVHAPMYDDQFHVFDYQGSIKNIIFRYKYNEKLYLHRAFAYWMNEHMKQHINGLENAVIVPIPCYRKKTTARGFDHIACIAKKLGQSLSLPVDTKCLFRMRETKTQHTLNHLERLENLNGAFCAVKNRRHETILLIDDIFTTGATVNEASKVLKENGSQKVIILTLTAVCDPKGNVQSS